MPGEQIAGGELHYRESLLLCFFKPMRDYLKIDLPLLM